VGTYGTSRPPTERDTIHYLNGVPTELGVLVSSGVTVAVNNATTANPFNAAVTCPGTMQGTLAGKTILLQPSSAGFVAVGLTPALTIANQSVVPAAFGTVHGVALAAGEKAIILMRPDVGWIQWIPSGGAGNLFVWELT
jgi:hypothetical protein